MPASIRNQRQTARQAQASNGPATKEYKIVDPHHRPDLNNEFAGVVVVRKPAGQFVRLTDAQARFYLDQGVLEEVK